MKKSIFIFIIFSIIVSCSPPKNFHRVNHAFYYRNHSNERNHNRNKIKRNYNSHGRRGNIVGTAQRYVGVPYKRGGENPSGFDCSGYVMYIYRKNRISVPRSASKQYRHGKRIQFQRAKPGDLVFFQTSWQRISHVGIYLGKYRFRHAPSSGKRVSYADMRTPHWKKCSSLMGTYL